MKKKSVSKKLFKLILVIFVILISLVLIINIPLLTLSNKTSKTDYSNWMSETLNDDQKVINIAMLGAHDAFSNKINIFSKVDELSADEIIKGFTGFLVKGFIVKQSVTQVNDAEALLKSGVRYLDIRLTYQNDNWYTKHNYISGEFKPIATQIKTFLENNSGEFLILDFQHIDGLDYFKKADYDVFYNMLDLYGLLDYAYIVNDLKNLTYGDLTNSGTQSKIIILSKFEDSSGLVLDYNSSIRSNWADSDDFEFIINFLKEDANQVKAGDSIYSFRVMQAVATMQLDGSGIIDALINWSLIDRAKKFNNYLVNSEDFDKLLNYLPIIMVDYADTNTNNFNENIMEKIIDFNQN